MTTTRYTDSGISPRTNVYAAREMLAHAQPVVVLDNFGLMKPIPKNRTQTIVFRRPVVFSAADTPLQEGVTPTATQFSYEDVNTTLKQYGQVVEITDHITDTSEDPVIRDASQQAGENIGRTREALNYGVLKAGTNVFYAGSASARNQVNTPVSLSKIRAVTRALLAQKAMRITKMLAPGPNFATKAIEPAWITTGHTDIDNDLRNVPGFVQEVDYGSRSKIHDSECGSVEGHRFILSPDLGSFTDAGGAKAGSGSEMVSATGTNADVYPLLSFGKEAYGIVPLKGKYAVSPSIIPVDMKTKDDPLGQRGIVGWKMWHTSVRLNELWMARLEVAATNL